MGDIFLHSIKVNDTYIAILNKKSVKFTNAQDLAQWLYLNKHITQNSGYICNKAGASIDTSKFVTTDTEQTITAKKVFNALVQFLNTLLDENGNVLLGSTGALIQLGNLNKLLHLTTSGRPIVNDGSTQQVAYLSDIPNITIDNALSTTSTNAVQNSIITNALNSKASIVTQSLGGTGYVQIGNLLVEWGSGAVTSWPKAFSGVPGFAYSSNYNGNTYMPTHSGISNTGVSWSRLSDRVGRWVAIGYIN